MGIDDKLKHAVQDAAGKAKEALGKATDNPGLVAEGKGDQVQAGVGKAGETLADKAGEAADKMKEGADKAMDKMQEKADDAEDAMKDKFAK